MTSLLVALHAGVAELVDAADKMRLKKLTIWLTDKNNESGLLVTVSNKLGELLETLTGNQQPSRQRRKVQRLPELARSNLITGSS